MTQVTNVRVVFDRKRQPAQYESSGASVEFVAIVGDKEDHVEVARTLLGDAKTLVLQELGLVPVGESASAPVRAAAAAAEGKPAATRGKAKAKDTTAAATETRQISTGEARVSPADEDPTAGGAATPAASAGSADLPEEATTAKPAGKPGVTLSNAEVQAAVTTLIKDKKIDVKTVKDLSRGYGVERIADIPADKLAEYKKKIDAAVEAASDAI